MKYVPDISFSNDCRACGRRVTGSSRIVLNDKAKAAAAQPDLFASTPVKP